MIKSFKVYIDICYIYNIISVINLVMIVSCIQMSFFYSGQQHYGQYMYKPFFQLAAYSVHVHILPVRTLYHQYQHSQCWHEAHSAPVSTIKYLYLPNSICSRPSSILQSRYIQYLKADTFSTTKQYIYILAHVCTTKIKDHVYGLVQLFYVSQTIYVVISSTSKICIQTLYAPCSFQSNPN